MRCSRRAGFHGTSKLIMIQQNWRLMPSAAASVQIMNRAPPS